MIELVAIHELDDALRTRFSVSIRLRAFLHGRMASDPTRVFGSAAEARELEGLGPASLWAGYVDEIPFTLIGQARGDGFGSSSCYPL